MAWSFKKALGWEASPYTKKEELFEGVPKPSDILLGMVIATMQKDLKLLNGKTKGSFGRNWSWTNDKISISWEWKDLAVNSYTTRFEIQNISICLGDKKLSLIFSEEARFKTAALKAMEWKREFDSNRVEMDRQAKSVSLIEEFFKPKPKPVAIEDKSPKEAWAAPVEEPNQLSQMIS